MAAVWQTATICSMPSGTEPSSTVLPAECFRQSASGSRYRRDD